MAYIETTSETRTVVYTDDKYQITHVTDRVSEMDDPACGTLPGRSVSVDEPDIWHVAIAPTVPGWAGHSLASCSSLGDAMAYIARDRSALSGEGA